MYNSRRALWRYPIFQIPLLFLVLFLIVAALFWLLGLGRPKVSVAITLDLSQSTYKSQTFNAPGSIMRHQIDAVDAYIAENSKLRTPNQIQIFGFGGTVVPLISSFHTDGNRIKTELNRSLNDPTIPEKVMSDRTDVNAALRESQKALNQTSKTCREVLLVTDGTGDTVTNDVIKAAQRNSIKINAMVVTSNVSNALYSIDLAKAAWQTGGIFLPTQGTAALSSLFLDKFFAHFNSNLRWIVLWLGAAWISLMWVLVLPVDRWILQNLLKIPINISGQIVLFNAFFWTAATPAFVWGLASGLPLLAACS